MRLCAYVCVRRRRRSSMSSCLPNNTVILTKKISTAAIENMTTKALEQQHTVHVHPLNILFSFSKMLFFLHYFKIIGTLCFVTTIDIQRKFLFKIRWIKENYLTNKNGRTCQFLQVSRLWKCTITSYYH